MNRTDDLDIAHRLLDDVYEEATGWLLQAGALLQASALLAALTGTLDLLGWLPQSYEPDRAIDFLLLMVALELFIWGRRWTRSAREQRRLTADADGA
jgi:hypothetical protein